jgi:dinuclear metal center YbgI/SA1388 family protein
MSVHVGPLSKYADELLHTNEIPDYPGALNGLQFENRSAIRTIAAAVDFSSRVLRHVVERGANFLVVHHGMFWGGSERVTGSTFRRYTALFDADIAVYSSHLPLDCHSEFGNNVLLAKELGLHPTQGFARFEGVPIGVSGEADLPTVELVSRANQFAQRHGGTVRASTFHIERRTRKWAICTGAGASSETLKEAHAAHIDTLIVGEGPHWTAVQAEESDLTIIYAGHYATETLGVCALAQHLAEKYDLPWLFIHAPTGL